MIYICELVGGPEDGHRFNVETELVEIRIPLSYYRQGPAPQELETWKLMYDPENFRYDLYHRIGEFEGCIVHAMHPHPHAIAKFQLVASGINLTEEKERYADGP